MRFLIAIVLAAASIPAAAQITLYGQEGFAGRSITLNGPARDLARQNFNDRASSAIVRGGRFEVCEHENFGGRCMVLRPGQYPSLQAMGMGDAISSARPLGRQARVEEQRFAPPPPVAYDYRRRGSERLFEAEVTSVRAVYGGPQQRCWVERDAVPMDERNVPGAIAGAVIGGILGHQ
ncbi:MAG: beta/gamma crystallin-related protein, partial [Usitatibacter sp.]